MRPTYLRIGLASLTIFVNLVVISVGPLAGQDDQPAGSEDEVLDNKFMPAPRELQQRLSRGKQAVQKGEFNVAVEELGEILSPEAGDDDPNTLQDYFILSANKSGAMPSLKNEAQRLIGTMPEQGRQLYELRYGSAARALLQEATAANDVNRISDVTRRYFHTKAGYEAMMLLGRDHLDRGRPLAAAMCFQRVISSPGRNIFDPEASLLLAACWLYADYPQRATDVLTALAERTPDAKVRVAGADVPLFRDRSQALPWLEKILGKLSPMIAQQRAHWTLYRGDPSRNGKSMGGIPVANYRWRTQMMHDPADEELVQEQLRQLSSSGGVLIPSVQPLAVNDVVLVRTPRMLLAIDFRTGKIIWPYPWDDSPNDMAQKTLDMPVMRNAPNPRGQELNERLWHDAAYGQLSSDGTSVFLLDDLGFANEISPQMLIGPNGFPQANGAWPKSHNKLVALSLAREGALQWIVGGEDGGDEPKLAGAFFLGAPLPVMGQLFVLAEVTGELRLMVLDPKTGALQWHQQLAHVDALTIVDDNLRRLAGATPSFADGVLVCPTSAGAVVAVDIASRSLLWGYQYGTNPYFSHAPRGFNRAVMPQAIPSDIFTDATVTIANGRVILTPAESDQIYCLDLLTGAPLWSPRDRGELLYVACVHQDNAVLVCRDKVTAISLKDGSNAWNQEIPLVSEAPTGRGYYSENAYYLPTAAAQLLKIHLDEGRVEQRINTRTPLGNLICYKDQVISQGADWVSAFYLIEPLRRWVEERLRENPKDRVALARKCDLLLQEGKRKEALEVMWTTYEADRTDESMRSLLVQTLLEALEEDFSSYADQAARLEPLIEQPEQRTAYLRLMSAGLEKAGDLANSFRAVMQLADAPHPASAGTSSLPLDQVDRRWSVQRDRWVRGRLASLLAAANKPEHAALRSEWDGLIRERQEKALATGARADLRRFLEQFAAHPDADPARLLYAKLLMQSGENLAAELHLAQLAADVTRPSAPAAHALLAQLLAAAQRPDQAAVYLQRVKQMWPDQVVLDGKTGAQVYDEGQKLPGVGEHLAGILDWPYGRVTVEVGDADQLSADVAYPVPLLETRGAWPFGTVVNIEAQQQHLPVAITVRDGHGREMQRAQLPTARSYTNRYDLTAVKANGHLIITSVQSEVMAIDSLRFAQSADEAILWRFERQETGSPLGSVNIKTLDHPWTHSHVRTVAADSSPARIPTGTMGPVTADGVCFQRMRQLICVDPISGETIWTRDNVDPGADLFGDDRYLFVVPYDQTQAIVLNTTTGEQIGTRDVEKLEQRWATCGRNVLAWSEMGDQLGLRLYDVWTGDVLWQEQFVKGSRGQLINGEEVAIVQPNGELVIASLRDGREHWRAQLEPIPQLAHFYIERTNDSYIVATSHPAPNSQRFSIVNPTSCTPILDGHVYALRRGDGTRLWQSPGVIDQYSIPMVQYNQLPVLVLVRSVSVKSQQNRTFSSLVCVDKRDGRVLFEQPEIPLPATAVTIGVSSDPSKKQVAIHLTTKTFTLTFSDDSIPPAAPVQTGDASSLINPLTSNRVKQWAGVIVDAFGESEQEAIDEQVEEPDADQAPPP